MKLFHGSRNNNVQLDKKAHYNVFGDALFFASDEDTARNYGDFVYSVEVDSDTVLTQQDLWYNLDAELVLNTLKTVAKEAFLNDIEENIERLYELVIDDENIKTSSDDAVILDCEDSALYICWKAQELRISLATKLGYKAVEMNDENGISYAVISPVLTMEF